MLQYDTNPAVFSVQDIISSLTLQVEGHSRLQRCLLSFIALKLYKLLAMPVHCACSSAMLRLLEGVWVNIACLGEYCVWRFRNLGKPDSLTTWSQQRSAATSRSGKTRPSGLFDDCNRLSLFHADMKTAKSMAAIRLHDRQAGALHVSADLYSTCSSTSKQMVRAAP